MVLAISAPCFHMSCVSMNARRPALSAVYWQWGHCPCSSSSSWNRSLKFSGNRGRCKRLRRGQLEAAVPRKLLSAKTGHWPERAAVDRIAGRHCRWVRRWSCGFGSSWSWLNLDADFPANEIEERNLVKCKKYRNSQQKLHGMRTETIIIKLLAAAHL